FRPNPKLDVEAAITELGVGEALVSMLDEKGRPGIVRRALIAPPESRLGAITAQERQQVMQHSLLAGHYEAAVDRESAYERLKERREEIAAQQAPPPPSRSSAPPREVESPLLEAAGDVLGALAKSAARSIGSSLGRQIMRGLFGSMSAPASTRRRR
ncbi:MAG: helicase HerA-like domain-containing protein, partial [Blastocatellia bacterium]